MGSDGNVGTGVLLGIETSCDETAAAVVADGRVVMSNVVASQGELHAQFGGVFPELASRQHVRDILPVIEQALRDASADWQDLAAIAVTCGPGLAGSLLVGVNVAKGLSLARGLPLIGVNHLEGHVYSNWLHSGGQVRSQESAGDRESVRAEDPPWPLLVLIASGGHTELVHVRGHGEYEVLGATLDDAAGEAFDKAARMLGLGYPGGPEIERLAGLGDATAFALPVADTRSPFDFSFSGLKTAVQRVATACEASGRPVPVADIAASFQVAAVSALVGRISRALTVRPVAEVHLAGGVSANGALRAALADCGEAPVRCPPLELCTDNAAMIAAAGFWALQAGRFSGLDLDVVPGLALGTG